MPLDPPSFMLASFSMFEAEYSLWRVAIVYTDRLLKDQNYDEFNESCLMPPFGTVVCTLSLPNFFPLVLNVMPYICANINMYRVGPLRPESV